MNRILCLTVWLWIYVGSYAISNIESAHQLTVRLMGEANAKHIIYKQKSSHKDFFSLRSKGKKIEITGNSANSMAVGLGHYLKYYCHTNISWDKSDSISLPAKLPCVAEPVVREARVKNRFFLNYCTFGYTMCWWQWDDWEHFIDWMAINGVNLPLAITGQESVWYKVWRQLGLTDLEVRSYFTGPAHLPWHRMINLDHWQGPLPMSWLEHQEKLQKQIVKRERELGMRPILPAFSGHVPEVLKRVYPNAKINRTSSWGGFKDEYRSYFLDPSDSLFNVIQKAFMSQQTELYGTDHVYGVDPFNEIDPPSWEPSFLENAGKTIYSSLSMCDSKAVWVQMTWLFYIDQSHWTLPRISAYLKAVPKDRILLLDYFAENTEVWKRTDSYFGQQFVWCYLGNFGGNTMLAGNLRETGKRIENAISNAGDNIKGVGSTLEGFDCNPMMYEYVLEKAWTQMPTDEEWIKLWADRRIGYEDETNRLVWRMLLDSVYTQPAKLGQAPLVNARPSLMGHGNWTTNPAYHYDNQMLRSMWNTMAQSLHNNKKHTSTQVFDFVNIGRQVLSNDFMAMRDSLTLAYEAKDIAMVGILGLKMTQLLKDLDILLARHPFFSLQRWLKSAEAFGINDKEKKYYRKNALTLVTTWGETPQSLNEYASRTWHGLVSDYYAPRWKMFISEVLSCLQNGKQFDQKAFNARMNEFERMFVDGEADKFIY